MTPSLRRCATTTALTACLGIPPAAAAPSLELGATSEGTPSLGVNLDWMHDLSHWHPALDWPPACCCCRARTARTMPPGS